MNQSLDSGSGLGISSQSHQNNQNLSVGHHSTGNGGRLGHIDPQNPLGSLSSVSSYPPLGGIGLSNGKNNF